MERGSRDGDHLLAKAASGHVASTAGLFLPWPFTSLRGWLTPVDVVIVVAALDHLALVVEVQHR